MNIKITQESNEYDKLLQILNLNVLQMCYKCVCIYLSIYISTFSL